MTTNTSRWMLAAAAAATLMTSPAGAQTTGEKLLITAFAVNMSNIGPGSSAVVEIDIDRWSTAAERAHLITTMVEKKENELLKALRAFKQAVPIELSALAARSGHTRLSSLGVREQQLPGVAETVAAHPYTANTPDPPGPEELLAVLRAAL